GDDEPCLLKQVNETCVQRNGGPSTKCLTVIVCGAKGHYRRGAHSPELFGVRHSGASIRKCVHFIPLGLSAVSDNSSSASTRLRARREINRAFGRRCIGASGVARRSNTPVCSTPRALLASRIGALGAPVCFAAVPKEGAD